MYRVRATTRQPRMFGYNSGLSRMRAAGVAIGLALLVTVSLAFGVAVRMGIAPEFDHQIVLDDQRRMVIHNGPSLPCASIPNPPHHDCFWPGWDSREFSVDYFTPNGA